MIFNEIIKIILLYPHGRWESENKKGKKQKNATQKKTKTKKLPKKKGYFPVDSLINLFTSSILNGSIEKF